MPERELDAGMIGSCVPGHYGAQASDVMLAETAISAAWNVQGDPARAPFVAEVRRLFDVSLPLIPNTTACGPAWTALWLGPKSWLLVTRGNTSVESQLAVFTEHRDALNSVSGALFDVSASRAAFVVSGRHAATVLAKSCPLDFHARAFPAAQCAQSVLGHVNALIWRPDANATFIAMVARSLARDVWNALCLSAAQYGYDVVPPGASR